MTNKVALDALCADILAHGVPSATLGAYADEIRRECAEKAIAWQVKLCADDDWSCERCTECNQLRYAIMGNIRG